VVTELHKGQVCINYAFTPASCLIDVDVENPSSSTSEINVELDKEVTRLARNAATTFAPRASGASKNPAYKGTFFGRTWV
jgi:hypothetical protein